MADRSKRDLIEKMAEVIRLALEIIVKIFP